MMNFINTKIGRIFFADIARLAVALEKNADATEALAKQASQKCEWKIYQWRDFEEAIADGWEPTPTVHTGEDGYCYAFFKREVK